MKTRLVVSLAAALLALVTFVPVGANAVGIGKQCDGFPGLGRRQCDAGLFCQKRPGTCAVIDNAGVCVRVPRICSYLVLPVCGCDGQTYSNDCRRQQAMVSLAHKGKCK